MAFVKKMYTGWLVPAVGLSWLVLISVLHFWLNIDHSDRNRVRLGYMPVISNLAAPLLDYATMAGDGLRINAVKFSSFAEMAEAFRHDRIEAALMIAPLSVLLRQQGEDVKVIYIGNRSESALVVRKDLEISGPGGLQGRKIAVPMRYSGHNIVLLGLQEQYGLTDVDIVEMNPPDMASALAAGSLDAYMVGEPFAAQTVRPGLAREILRPEEVWPDFICNLMVVREKIIREYPERVRLLVWGAVRAGIWAQANKKEAARIVSRYWNQPEQLVEYVMTNPARSIVYDRYIPVSEELQYLADEMCRFGLLENPDITGLVDDSFARSADSSNVTGIKSIVFIP
ncbi:MAG TPA: ABC transporter substrate-binding protein [Thermodesulfobacteriaceae bacterium]|nr:ABC transporter substrate-binding protein [Thermodesulfobacteriaceae bacterium]